MMKLSTGQDSMLGSYYDNCKALLGEECSATKFFADKIKDSPEGRNEEVLADESQMMFLIGSMVEKDAQS